METHPAISHPDFWPRMNTVASMVQTKPADVETEFHGFKEL